MATDLLTRQKDVFSDEDIKTITGNDFANEQLLTFLAVQEEARRLEGSLEAFVKEAWKVLEPGKKLKWNWHLGVICRWMEAFHERRVLELPDGRKQPCNRLILNVPFRTSKSTIMVCFNAWVWAKKSSHQFLCLSNSDDLAVRDGLACRTLVDSEWYQQRWGIRFSLAQDQKQKKNYKTSTHGHRNSQSLTGSLTGKGGDTIIVDDPHDAKRVMSAAWRKQVLDAYDQGASTRLNDPAESGIVIIMQRLHPNDLVGHLLEDNAEDEGEYWHLLRFPMEYDPDLAIEPPKGMPGDARTKPKELLWEDRFPKGTVKTYWKRLGQFGGSGQLQQNPTADEGGILKRHMWGVWPKKRHFPKVEHTLLSFDTAFTQKDFDRNMEAESVKQQSRSAMTAWGVFYDEYQKRYRLLMIEAWADWVDYPTLREKAKEFTKRHWPDRILIEKKASGQSLIQDLRRAEGKLAVPIIGYNPDTDKVSRAYAVSAMLEDGLIVVPEGRRWAEEVIAECAEFPVGPRDDYPDTCTQAWLWFRNSWRVENSKDTKEFDLMADFEDDTPKVAAYG